MFWYISVYCLTILRTRHMLDVIQDVLIVIVTALKNSLESKIYVIYVIIVISHSAGKFLFAK